MLKDLGDVMNDLREAFNIITILTNDRGKLQDLFAVFNVQIKGLHDIRKTLEEDLTLYTHPPIPYIDATNALSSLKLLVKLSRTKSRRFLPRSQL